MGWLRASASIFLAGLLFGAPGAFARNISAVVASPDEAHMAWVSAQHFAALAAKKGVKLKLSRAPIGETPASSKKSLPKKPPQLFVQPLRALARDIPALSVLELPFFYPDLAAVHRALKGKLGNALHDSAREQGWEILAYWDEGLHVMSGNLAYTHPARLQGREFLLLRDDPVAEIELRALDVWSKRARPASLAQLHKECLVGSRSATLQQIRAEQIARVHLDLTLTRHRYEGWVIAMRSTDWARLTPSRQTVLIDTLSEMQPWQRDRAKQEEDAALKELIKDGRMTAHPLDADTWTTYRNMQPDWASFFSPTMPNALKKHLLGFATAAVGDHLGARGQEPISQVPPQSPQGKRGSQVRAGNREPATPGYAELSTFLQHIQPPQRVKHGIKTR